MYRVIDHQLHSGYTSLYYVVSDAVIATESGTNGKYISTVFSDLGVW